MNFQRCAARLCCALCVLLAASAAAAQTLADAYKPAYGQPGKDVVWIATADATLAREYS